MSVWLAAVVGLGLLALGFLLGRRRGSPLEAPDRTVDRSHLEALIDASPLAITGGDLEGRIILWSAAAEEIFGWTADEVIGKPYPAVPDELKPEWGEMRRRVLAGERIQGVETRRVTRDGRTLDVSVSAAPIRGPDGEMIGTVALVTDLSQSVQTAREMEQLETQLRQAQKLEVVGRLSAGIAHDFNNLLTAIRGNAELLLAEDIDAGLESELREIARSAERAGALTRQLLSFAHKRRVKARPVDVNRLVMGMEALAQRLIGETIELRVELSVDTGAVLTDPSQVEQVVMNLVVNARDALPEGGRITIRTRAADVDAAEAASLPYEVRPGPYAVISVADDGIGMGPDTVGRIFEPFFTTKPSGVGTGLGLSTVYSIVKQSRGHIRVESTPGVGSRFHVYLPRHDAVDASREERQVAAPARGGSETILVVEDEEAVLSMAKRALERQGYTVLTALSGRQALAVALKHPGEIDLLFCDAVMPDLTGGEVADRIAAAHPGIRILMTSGYDRSQLADEDALADLAFLPKPYTPRELTTRVRRELGPPAR